MSSSDRITWIKATASSSSDNCVELGVRDGGVFVRDSKNPQGPKLRATPSAIGAWIEAAKNGELDHLI